VVTLAGIGFLYVPGLILLAWNTSRVFLLFAYLGIKKGLIILSAGYFLYLQESRTKISKRKITGTGKSGLRCAVHKLVDLSLTKTVEIHMVSLHLTKQQKEDGHLNPEEWNGLNSQKLLIQEMGSSHSVDQPFSHFKSNF
jgi:hypothetical protein